MRHPHHRIARGAAALGGLLLVLAGTDASAFEQRRNTVSFGFQGGATSLECTGEYGRSGYESGTTYYGLENYRLGPAFGVRLRYSLDRSHAVGASFEDLRFGRKSGLGGDPNVAKQFQLNTFMIDYYVYIQRRERLTPYFVIGAGLQRSTFRFGKSDNLIPPMGVGANLGAGLEYFVRPPFSLDLTVRGYYMSFRGSGEWNYDGPGGLAGSAQLGFHYYLLN